MSENSDENFQNVSSVSIQTRELTLSQGCENDGDESLSSDTTQVRKKSRKPKRKKSSVDPKAVDENHSKRMKTSAEFLKLKAQSVVPVVKTEFCGDSKDFRTTVKPEDCTNMVRPLANIIMDLPSVFNSATNKPSEVSDTEDKENKQAVPSDFAYFKDIHEELLRIRGDRSGGSGSDFIVEDLDASHIQLLMYSSESFEYPLDVKWDPPRCAKGDACCALTLPIDDPDGVFRSRDRTRKKKCPLIARLTPTEWQSYQFNHLFVSDSRMCFLCETHLFNVFYNAKLNADTVHIDNEVRYLTYRIGRDREGGFFDQCLLKPDQKHWCGFLECAWRLDVTMLKWAVDAHTGQPFIDITACRWKPKNAEIQKPDYKSLAEKQRGRTNKEDEIDKFANEIFASIEED
jgi:hypothetical protein